MKTKLLAIAGLSILLSGPAQAWQDLDADTSSESTEEFNQRLANNAPLTYATQIRLMQQQVYEAHKMRCLLERMSSKRVSQDCYPQQQTQDE